jgi:ribose 1,5-bisphosphokinase
VSGVFVAVVGPSGAGKDTLIAAARDRLSTDPRFVFVRRVVTRPEGGNEDHDTLDPALFPLAVAEGAFVLHWGAHGLHYGIPARAAAVVGEGGIAIANLSRSSIGMARLVFPTLSVVSVTAPPEVLARRLAGRGRETVSDIAARLSTAAPLLSGDDVVTIDNGAELSAAVDRFVAHLQSLAQ